LWTNAVYSASLFVDVRGSAGRMTWVRAYAV
jgi:hypothetical protein